ncbi:Uncharacterised protein at_DN0314 [Pycnogonum litorale]
MQMLAMDLFSLAGVSYLLTVDQYSKWPNCYQLKNTRACDIISLLRRQFVDFGKPDSIVSDNGPPFNSFEFRSFLKENDIKHTPSSPYYPQSNGLAERNVQTVKNCLKKALESKQDLLDVLCALRSTSSSDGLPSPSVLLQGRNLCSMLHCCSQLKPINVDTAHIDQLLRRRHDNIAFFDKGSGTLPHLPNGQLVRCKMGHRNWMRGQVVSHEETPYSYRVSLENGASARKTRSHLRPTKEKFSLTTVDPPLPGMHLAQSAAGGTPGCSDSDGYDGSSVENPIAGSPRHSQQPCPRRTLRPVHM